MNRAFSAPIRLLDINPGLSPWAGMTDAVGVSTLGLFEDILSKSQKDHAGRIVKDAEDVVRLIQRNRVDLNAESIREILSKHGTDEFYERARRGCAPGWKHRPPFS